MPERRRSLAGSSGTLLPLFDRELACTSELSLEREAEGDFFLQDIGQGFAFRPGSFDSANRYETQLPIPSIALDLLPMRSISVLQWLLNGES